MVYNRTLCKFHEAYGPHRHQEETPTNTETAVSHVDIGSHPFKSSLVTTQLPGYIIGEKD